MKKIGILSDTHSCLDSKYAQYLADCDEIWHAGDFGDISVAEMLSSLAVLRGVCGNIDHGEVRRSFRELEIFEVEGVRVLLTHIAGHPDRPAPGIRKLIKENNIDMLVCGHSHLLRIQYDEATGCLYVNPGAAGRQGWQLKRTLVTLVLDNGDIRDCNVIELA